MCFNSELVCGKHFVSGQQAPYWHKHDVDLPRKIMRTQRELKGQRSDMNLRAVEQDRELKW